MNINDLFNPQNTNEIIGHDEKLFFFKKLILNKNFPKVILLSGEKGIGKFTIINHLMHIYFDKDNYDEKKNLIVGKSRFNTNFLNNTFSNIIYLKKKYLQNLKIDDVRHLRSTLQKKPILDDNRFIILDDIEDFNTNSLNALLKIIEEPGNNDYFIIIHDKSKPILETIKSRCLDIKITLNESTRLKIISSLLNKHSMEEIFAKEFIKVSPGNYLKYNFIFTEKNISLEDGFFVNLQKIVKIYKKEKNTIYRDLMIFYTDYLLKLKNIDNKLIKNRSFIIKSINEFFIYNLNPNTLINSLEGKLNE